MAKMYEMVWRSNNKKFYERTRDTETIEVIIKQIFPTFYLYEENNNGEYKFILDENVKLSKKVFDKEKDYRDYLGVMDSVGRNVYGTQQAVYNHIRKNFFGNGITLTPRIWHFDIETIPDRGAGFPDPQLAEFPITCIQIYDTFEKKNILLLIKPLDDEFSFKKRNPNTIIKVCKDEKHLLETFVKLMDYMKPSILSAWNGENFDVPYITNRAKKIPGFNYRKLSPISVIKEKNVDDVIIYEWEGITLVDAMIAYKSFTYITQTSYSLDNIANVELGIGSGKVDYGEYKDIIEFHEKDYDKFMDYAIQDVQILKGLDEKLNLNQLLIMLSTLMGINPADAFGTVKPWGTYLINKALEQNIVMPESTKHQLDEGIIGGFVAEPQVGLWNWVASIDYDSMYPNQIIAQNMSAETYIPYDRLPEELKTLYDTYMVDEDETKFLDESIAEEVSVLCKKYNVSFGINAFFKKDKIGIMPELVSEIYEDRKIAKGKMLKYKVLKTLLNETIK